MTKKKLLRIIALAMLMAAIVFLGYALSHPELGKTIYMGDYRFGAAQWHVCYMIYGVSMVLMFLVSFFVKEKKLR